ncbi:MAG: nickel/cobalt transporter [Lentilitoribacter sp.]
MLKLPQKLLLACILILGFISTALAQSSLGIGANESQIVVQGPFANLWATINAYQQQFYRALTTALREMKTEPAKLWLLVGMSFAYGVFHAAGPGHGKAVISSYMIANEVELKRGITLSFMSAFMQGITAIVVVGAVYFILRGTAISMSDATFVLEAASYVLIILFGCWLLWKKTKSWFAPKDHDHNHSHQHDEHNHEHEHAHHDHVHHDHSHEHLAHGETCSSCGHAHMPDPKSLSGDLTLRQAWSAVIAVGLRPCSGAVIVLSFALLHNLYLGGILSVFAMSIGTAITVSILATLAVTAKNTAVRFANSDRAAMRIGSTIEVLGAVLIIVLGILLLGAVLS